MSKSANLKVINHPDRDEIIAKLVMGFSPNDIHEWLAGKYTNVSESKFVITEKNLKSFQENYLDIYNLIQEDLAKTKSALARSEEDVQLAVQNSPAYKDIMIKSANEELDIRIVVNRLATALETRFAQVFDEIQADPRNINTKVDRLLIDYAEAFGNVLEKCHKFTTTPQDQVVQHNVTLQVMDQHTTVFYNSIRAILEKMNLENSLQFLELYNNEIAKAKLPTAEPATSPEFRLAEAKLLSETINQKINE